MSHPSPDHAQPAYSYVVPAFNEVDSVDELWQQIAAFSAAQGWSYEVVFIDDGSTDGTLDKLQALARAHEPVRLIMLGRNQGKSAAYRAGFAAARGQRLITLDADLQDDPNELPRLLVKMEEGYDLVVGRKVGRTTTEPTKAYPSRVFNGIKRLLFGLDLHDTNCGFRVMDRAVAQSINLVGDRYRFIPEMAHLAGYRVTEAQVQLRPRLYGKSKYGLARFWTGLMDLLAVRFVFGYLNRPLQFFGVLAVVFITLGVGLELYVLAMKLMGGQFRTHIAALIIGVSSILAGMQFLAVGLIGEMLSGSGAKPVVREYQPTTTDTRP